MKVSGDTGMEGEWGGDVRGACRLVGRVGTG